MAYVIDLPVTPRYHVFLTVLMVFVFWIPIIAFAWFLAFYCFFFDEMKYESLTYEEYLDDCMDMFHVETEEDVAKVLKASEELQEYYRKKNKPLPQDLLNYSDNSTGVSGDFDRERRMNEWDSPDLILIQEVLAWVRDDWEYAAEVELDDKFEFSVSDLEFYYKYLYINREKFSGPRSNRFETNSHFLCSNTGVSSKNPTLLLNALGDLAPRDIRLLYTSTPLDDFRFFYWNERTELKKT